MFCINSSNPPSRPLGIISAIALVCCLTASIVFLAALVLDKYSERWSRSAR